MGRCVVIFVFLLCCFSQMQGQDRRIDSAWVGDVRITVDKSLNEQGRTVVCFFALPNGNSTEWTMGKKMEPGDNWHYDIQHIAAQTAFIRSKMSNVNFVVVYLENKFRSWPSWKEKHPEFKTRIPQLIDSISSAIAGKKKEVYLSAHSGGGSFIFGYLAGVSSIPSFIKRISFLDADYGYDSSYYPKLHDWLSRVKGSSLTVFAYNDSRVIFNGKRLVSDTGGTWYRSHLMMLHLKNDHPLALQETDSLSIYKSDNKRIGFFMKKNIDNGIYHTQQVELNGFIHSVFCGTRYDSDGYQYYGPRAYSTFIK